MGFREVGNPPILATAGKQTNAADQTVHADTGVIVASTVTQAASRLIECRIIAGGSVAVVWQLQQRNAANAANDSPSPYTFYTAAGQSAEFVFQLKVAPGERVRVTNDGVLAGTSAASIQAEVLS